MISIFSCHFLQTVEVSPWKEISLKLGSKSKHTSGKRKPDFRLQGNKAGNIPQTQTQAGVTWQHETLAAAARVNIRKLK